VRYSTPKAVLPSIGTRVLGHDGSPLPNLFAAGGAAAGVSGSQASW
jgi:hypothetical protein